MQNDITRDTFDPTKHYAEVLMQQGRVQVDADWNEQVALTARRDETTAADIIGKCGGPAGNAAFGLSATQPPTTGGAASASAGSALRIKPGGTTAADFLLSAGRYYVDGIQCENEAPVLYTRQPDRFNVPALAAGRSYLIYLDVWQRHITALQDPLIQEAALGGPDHGTRARTVWQVFALDLGSSGVVANNPCASGANLFDALSAPGTAMLTADTAKVQAATDPCLVPSGAGFTGLENRLYRVEIHNPGGAINADTAAGSVVTLPGANDPKNQITVNGGTWAAGNAVEIFPSKTGAPKMKSQLASITAVNGSVLTLNIPVSSDVTAADQPLLRRAGATWKWSGENASVVTPVEKIDGKKITVSSLGPDDSRGFGPNAWVEILDDALELGGLPGELAQIEEVDPATRIVTLKSPAAKLAANPDGVLSSRHPFMRRWDGVNAVKFVADAATNWLPLESGVQVRFANGTYSTGDYWEIPARTATAKSPDGQIEWPENATNRLALPPRGIKHHYCRLGIVTVKDDGSIETTDCRCLYPALAAVPRLFYVSGDGQEVMPDLALEGIYPKLPAPLIAGVANAQCLEKPAAVQFNVTLGNGRVAGKGGVAIAKSVTVPTDASGLASCDFYLDPTNWSHQVVARLLDGNGQAVSLPLIFNANLSVASQVAYDPSKCPNLSGAYTVQAAIDRLCQVGHGKCCCVTVGKEGEFERLDQAISALIDAKSERDICLCLMPGDHQLPYGLTIQPKPDPNGTINPTHVKITGCGRASRLYLKNNTIRVSALASFALGDLSLFVLEDAETIDNRSPITITGCDEVNITGCAILGAHKIEGFSSLLTIAARKRVSLSQNVIESYSQGALIKTLGSDAGSVTDIQGNPLESVMRDAAQKLAKGGTKAKRAMANAVRKAAPDTPKNVLKEFTATKIPANDPTIATDAIQSLLFQTAVTALKIADAQADLFVLSNTIVGEVIFYGTEYSIGPVILARVAARIKAGSTLQPTQRDADVDGNILTRLTVDKRIGADVPGSAKISDVFNRLTITNNTFSSQSNGFLAGHLITNGNLFVVPATKVVVGIATGNSLICVATSADLANSTLQYGVPTTGNTPSPFFKESANLITLTSV